MTNSVTNRRRLLLGLSTSVVAWTAGCSTVLPFACDPGEDAIGDVPDVAFDVADMGGFYEALETDPYSREVTIHGEVTAIGTDPPHPDAGSAESGLMIAETSGRAFVALGAQPQVSIDFDVATGSPNMEDCVAVTGVPVYTGIVHIPYPRSFEIL